MPEKQLNDIVNRINNFVIYLFVIQLGILTLISLTLEENVSFEDLQAHMVLP